MYASQTGVPKYIKQTLTNLKKEIDNTIMVGDVKIPLSNIDRLSRQKINNETLSLNYMLEQMKRTDIYRTFHPLATEYTVLLNAHGTFFRIVSMFGYKTIFKNSKILKSYQASFLTTMIWNWKPIIKRKLENSQICED